MINIWPIIVFSAFLILLVIRDREKLNFYWSEKYFVPKHCCLSHRTQLFLLIYQIFGVIIMV